MAVLTSMAGWAAWSTFTRFIQLGLCHRSFNSPGAWPGTAMFFAVGAGFGYWMDGVEARQRDTVQRLRDRLIASREARAEQSVFGQAERERLYAKLEEATRKAADE